MKQNKLYILSFMFLLLWGITSCENESPVESTGVSDANGITLKLSIPHPVTSRAAVTEEAGEDALNENTIQTLDVFIYREGADDCLLYRHFTFSPQLTNIQNY